MRRQLRLFPLAPWKEIRRMHTSRLTMRLALFSLLCTPIAHAQVPPSVATQHNDNARTGANTAEVLLTPANVSVQKFGKLFTRNLDANVNGQVLYVPNVVI